MKNIAVVFVVFVFYCFSSIQAQSVEKVQPGEALSDEELKSLQGPTHCMSQKTQDPEAEEAPSFIELLTTNLTTGSFVQSTGLSSGCEAGKMALKGDDVSKIYIENNMNELAFDMASGKGLYLNTLSHLIGCESAVNSEFGKMSQVSYQDFEFDKNKVDAFYNILVSRINKNEILNNNCQTN